jgi:hypothetical protein
LSMLHCYNLTALITGSASAQSHPESTPVCQEDS